MFIIYILITRYTTLAMIPEESIKSRIKSDVISLLMSTYKSVFPNVDDYVCRQKMNLEYLCFSTLPPGFFF